ncbi:MAG: hypothetical protein UV82_C0003G0002 [Candidatus Magasanikbacteria bacterium GW2011_GWD2_43_18]|uniref:Peptidase C39-like domain-containing protein n=1 Tax=Candidatus Magasanikbacteria bacterium GW2011_GWE2_42_7 TaxID=1619052 RepID=A0A0G1BFL6_9BACT|nr:MAG: hypothetical protein UV18_C0012G0014 [Candidatus Magasanikbacteria bacterium GW2011_GWC2_42_27]KKS72175.1 MAG: hypothetical protein UV42_C0012G0002 [Candidatus Magasanikbacteria bacterium GW2011_GWE2_42_7]KKT04903.1 MAG: hypothetical protein UV82_C0003G0002 [Candidatus Magasanikbacteria bacterium GW2011_GWD2_43_18]KKT25409.1 MAG: hypothetical protein UW10_C0008G0021 [Candidatus Magasanikbacteria bacterium GW2011_GWA2_43_9]HBB37819.1 hypothetical protein [Candidatus Magasanikbacteria bac
MIFHVSSKKIALTLTLGGLCFFVTPTLAATLDIPFTSQAPDGVWVQPWQDACEETSVLMVHRYYIGNTIKTTAEAKNAILEIFDIKHVLFEESFDETVAMMAETINNFLPWSARVVENPTIADIKAEIDAGRPVIVPAYAPALHNAYFRGYFPYHMFVISGYDDAAQVFIAEDPGTRYGHAYRYSYNTVMNAMHDFVAGDTANGPKRVLFTSPELSATAQLDGDQDSLSKAEEIAAGTVSYLFDSDGDGFGDGIEMKYGYLPTKNEQQLVKNGVLLIAPRSPRVYVVDANTKRHISSEAVFFRHGWSWKMLEWISDAMMDAIPEGKPLT